MLFRVCVFIKIDYIARPARRIRLKNIKPFSLLPLGDIMEINTVRYISKSLAIILSTAIVTACTADRNASDDSSKNSNSEAAVVETTPNPTSTLEPQTELDSTGYAYDLVPPFNISSSAPSGKFQIAELDTSFPAQASDINAWLQSEFDNNAVVRSHAWSIWGALTSLTDFAIENPNNAAIGANLLPAFMTWYSSYEVYGSNSSANLNCTQTSASVTDKHGIKRCRAGSLLDFNKFSLVESKYVIDQKYNDLVTLTNKVNNNPTPIDMPPFVSSQFQQNSNTNVSFSLKPVYYLLKNNAFNLLPYWGGQQAGTSSDNNKPTPNTWKQCVMVVVGTPTSPAPSICNPGSGNANASAPSEGWQPVELSEFMAIPVTQTMLDELEFAKKSPIQSSSIFSLGLSNDKQPKVGDVAVLVGMHITVRETQDWVWQTVYWSPKNLQQVTMNTDYPVFPPKTDTYIAGPNYPGSSFDNPFGQSSNTPDSVPTWAKNYAMCTAYSPVYPVQPRNGGTNSGTFAQICYNPWLETSFETLNGHFSKTGLNSNCMTCHGQASYNGAVTPPTSSCELPQGFGYYGNGYIPRDNSCLINKNFEYDFSWHLSNAYKSATTPASNEAVINQKPPTVAPSFSH